MWLNFKKIDVYKHIYSIKQKKPPKMYYVYYLLKDKIK